jgi:DtxR family transcriptional regulator, Mn-dependent transcriptional regulator
MFGSHSTMRWDILTDRSGGHMSATEYTPSIENYLKAIYELSRPSGVATVADVADRLDIARASVSGMVRRLEEQGLIEHERYRGLRLSAQGRRVALRLIRRHRVIEAYLVTALGYTWDRVHDEAERLEHTASDELVDRMAAAIGEPVVDPHGAPIPTTAGSVEEPSYRLLSELEVGEEARIARVEDEDPELLRYLASLALVPGAIVRIVERAPFGGPLSVRIGRRTHAIGAPLATQVLVTESGR